MIPTGRPSGVQDSGWWDISLPHPESTRPPLASHYYTPAHRRPCFLTLPRRVYLSTIVEWFPLARSTRIGCGSGGSSALIVLGRLQAVRRTGSSSAAADPGRQSRPPRVHLRSHRKVLHHYGFDALLRRAARSPALRRRRPARPPPQELRSRTARRPAAMSPQRTITEPVPAAKVSLPSISGRPTS